MGARRVGIPTDSLDARSFILGMQKELGDSATDEQLVDYIWKTLNKGVVIPVRSAVRGLFWREGG